MNSAKCQEEQCFLVLDLRYFGGPNLQGKGISITFTCTNFPHSLIGIFSVAHSQTFISQIAGYILCMILDSVKNVIM